MTMDRKWLCPVVQVRLQDLHGCHSPRCELPSGRMQQAVAGEKQAEAGLLQVGRFPVSYRRLEQLQEEPGSVCPGIWFWFWCSLTL